MCWPSAPLAPPRPLGGPHPYPGGVLADRWGRKRALVTCNGLALMGYGLYLVSPHWPLAFAGLACTMAWSSLALPTTFAVIAASLPPERRATGVTVQSILTRLLIVLAPPFGGLLIGRIGLPAGVRAGLAITLVLGLFRLLAQHRCYAEPPLVARPAPVSLTHTWRALPVTLKRFLLAERTVRRGQGLAAIVVVLYATHVLGLSAATFGPLVALRMATSALAYLPAATLADRHGRTPFVLASFVCYALFPFLLVSAQGPVGLVAASSGIAAAGSAASPSPWSSTQCWPDGTSGTTSSSRSPRARPSWAPDSWGRAGCSAPGRGATSRKIRR